MAPGTRLHKLTSIVLLTLGAVLLFLAQSAFWVNHTVFDQTTFATITTNTVLSEQNRDAISMSIVDNALADKPLVKRVIGQRAQSLISGILGSDLSNQVVSTLVNKAYVYATASNRSDIAIDLTPIKAPLAAILAVADKTGRDIPQTNFNIPDQIVLLSKNALPDFSGTITLMLWVAPLLWLGTIVCLAAYIYMGRRNYAAKIYKVGLVIIIVAVFGLLTTPFIPPPIAAAIHDSGMRIVTSSMITNFLAPFSSQMWYMLGFTLVALLIFNQRFNIIKYVQTTLNKAGSLGSKVADKGLSQRNPKPKSKSKSKK